MYFGSKPSTAMVAMSGTVDLKTHFTPWGSRIYAFSTPCLRLGDRVGGRVPFLGGRVGWRDEVARDPVGGGITELPEKHTHLNINWGWSWCWCWSGGVGAGVRVEIGSGMPGWGCMRSGVHSWG